RVYIVYSEPHNGEVAELEQESIALKVPGVGETRDASSRLTQPAPAASSAGGSGTRRGTHWSGCPDLDNEPDQEFPGKRDLSRGSGQQHGRSHGSQCPIGRLLGRQ
ncbi:hypothetical protein P7K49_037614, partial [Saguinus oedipus]